MPTIIFRRKVLASITANLFSFDSPWKQLVLFDPSDPSGFGWFRVHSAVIVLQDCVLSFLIGKFIY